MGAAICHSDHIEANGLECVEDIDEPIWKHGDSLGWNIQDYGIEWRRTLLAHGYF